MARKAIALLFVGTLFVVGLFSLSGCIVVNEVTYSCLKNGAKLTVIDDEVDGNKTYDIVVTNSNGKSVKWTAEGNNYRLISAGGSGHFRYSETGTIYNVSLNGDSARIQLHSGADVLNIWGTYDRNLF